MSNSSKSTDFGSLIDRLLKAAVEVKETISQAHQAQKDLKREVRDATQTIQTKTTEAVNAVATAFNSQKGVELLGEVKLAHTQWVEHLERGVEARTALEALVVDSREGLEVAVENAGRELGSIVLQAESICEEAKRRLRHIEEIEKQAVQSLRRLEESHDQRGIHEPDGR